MPYVALDALQWPDIKVTPTEDGGWMYVPLAGYHIKWHPMPGQSGVVDRFHVTREAREGRPDARAYYAINNTGHREYYAPGKYGGPSDWRTTERIVGDLEVFDQLAKAFLRMIRDDVGNDRDALQKGFEQRKAAAEQKFAAGQSSMQVREELEARLRKLQARGFGTNLERLKQSQCSPPVLAARRAVIEALEAAHPEADDARAAAADLRNVLPLPDAPPSPRVASPPRGRRLGQVGGEGPVVMVHDKDEPAPGPNDNNAPAGSPRAGTRKRPGPGSQSDF